MGNRLKNGVFAFTDETMIDRSKPNSDLETYTRAQHYFNSNNLESCLVLLSKLSRNNYAPANTFMGYLCLIGLGVDLDRNKAREFFEKASLDSHLYARAFLIRMDIEDGNFLDKIFKSLEAICLIPYAVLLKLSSKPENQSKLLFRIDTSTS